MRKALIVIPARGGSKGIPRKNLRPLCGKPLIYYAITAAQEVPEAVCVVTTEDEEIAFFADRFGARTVKRPPHLSEDHVTIDPVVSHAVATVEEMTGESYQVIVTVQPTSPLIQSSDISSVIAMFAEDSSLDTVISATDDRHLRWRQQGEDFVPEYEKRVNRQQLPQTFRETGAAIACRRETLNGGSRIGKKVRLFPIPANRSIDIDDLTDFWLCEKIMSRKKIVLTVAGNKKIGMGHAYRGIMIAHELINFEITFVCCEEDDLAQEHIRMHNYPLVVTKQENLQAAVLSLAPDMVINDVLDTSADYVMSLKKAGITVVNFEDMGLGAEVADLVINALYPHQLPKEHILVGPRYFCLRDEFLHAPHRKFPETVTRVIVTFGGVDEGDLTNRVLGQLAGTLCEAGIGIDVILGPGYLHHERLGQMRYHEMYPNVSVVTATPTISDYMARADLAVTSAGRTVLELASLGVPTIVISQNSRETTHKFASSENGIINLGLRTEVSDQLIGETVLKVVSDNALRRTMHEKMKKMNLRAGKQRVIDKISSLLNSGRISE